MNKSPLDQCSFVGDKTSYSAIGDDEQVWRNPQNDLLIFDTKKKKVVKIIKDTEERYQTGSSQGELRIGNSKDNIERYQEKPSPNKIEGGNPYTRREHK